MEDDLFKRFYNKELGVSFFYNSLLTRQKDLLNADPNHDLHLKHEELKFSISKLSSEANVGLQLFGLEKGLRSSLNENETITEEKGTKEHQIAGNETAYTTTIFPSTIGNIMIRRYLVSHKGKGYLLAFQDRLENFESDQSQKIIETILETFKFIDS